MSSAITEVKANEEAQSRKVIEARRQGSSPEKDLVLCFWFLCLCWTCPVPPHVVEVERSETSTT